MYDNILKELPVYKVFGNLNKSEDFKLSESRALANDNGIQLFVENLRQQIGRAGVPFSKTIGTHPDFTDLVQNQTAVAPITSLFLDIKGSTQLFEKYEYEKACEMQDAIIQSAIYLIQAFDGHIVRIPGDGIFAVFGRDDYSIENGALDSINAASTIVFVLESFLTDVFTQNGLKPVRIRVGIDHDDKALWKHNGIEGCHELSPHGLHVSMASKLQNKANSNCVMLGNNIKDLLQLPEDLLSVKKYTENGEEKSDHYVRTNYKMWQFDWEKHVGHFTWVPKKSGRFLPAPSNQPSFNLISALIDDENTLIRKFSSSMEVLEKGHILKFSLNALPAGCSIRWFVENNGTEAQENNCVRYEIVEARNKTSVERETAYHGVHYLICKVTFPSGKIAEKRITVPVGATFVSSLRDVTGTTSSVRISTPKRTLLNPPI